MKKIYSFLLMATALLISANIQAAVQINSLDELKAAFVGGGDYIIAENASGWTTISETLRLYANKSSEGKELTLDLNGNTLTFTRAHGIELYKGTLTIKNSKETRRAKLETTSTESNTYLITVYGSNDVSDTQWSTLNVEGNIDLEAKGFSSNAPQGVGIVVDIFGGKAATYLLDGNALTAEGFLEDYYKNADETLAQTTYSDNYNVCGARGGSNPNYTFSATLTDRDNAFTRELVDYVTANYKYKASTKTFNSKRENGAWEYVGKNQVAAAFQYSAERGWAYGVTVNLEEGVTVYGSKYGVKVNGTLINDNSNLPTVNVKAGATVKSDPGTEIGLTNTESVAIYASGAGAWNIEGTVSGNNGIYIKSGTMTVSGDAVIEGTGAYSQVSITDRVSGVNAAGNAITIDDNKNYAGDIQVSVSGNPTVSSTNGYAFVATTTIASKNPPTGQSISITGGTFAGSDNTGTITFDGDLGESVVANNSIQGGNFSDETVLNYIDQTGSLIVAENTNGEIKYTLTATPVGATTPTVVGENDPMLDDAIQSSDIVKLKYGTGQTLTTDVACAYLSISNAQTVTIPAGKTLSAGTVVLGNDAVIVVEPGGKLVVTGETGIVAWNPSNIVLETSDDAPAQLLLAPEATANTRPAATVILKSKSWRTDANNKVYQFFGTPVTDVTAFTMNGESDRMAYVYQLGSTATIGSLTVASPFANPEIFQEGVIYYLLSNNDADHLLDYTFKGNLLGNNNIVANVETNWSPFANSYTGNISVNELLSALSTEYGTDNSTVETNVYTYSYIGANKLSWNVNNLLDGISNVAPMQPIMLKNHGTATNFTVDYEDLVWNARNSAPARRAISGMDKVKVHVTAADGSSDYVVLAQADQFSAEYENGYDAEKYMNDFMNIYVNDEHKQQTFATNNINNTLIGFDVVEAGMYTLSFSDVMGNNLVLVDLANGARINMEEGATYTFAASANEANDARFQVVEARKMPTDVEVVNAAVKAQKGIYSLVGAYLAENFDVLPAGLYVVNGVKVVK